MHPTQHTQYSNSLPPSHNFALAVVPAVGSFASNKAQATGAITALSQNSTVVVQEVPRRTAGQYSAGSDGVDATAASSSAFGTSSSVAKDVVSEKGCLESLA